MNTPILEAGEKFSRDAITKPFGNFVISRSSDSGDNFTRSAVADGATLGATFSEYSLFDRAGATPAKPLILPRPAEENKMAAPGEDSAFPAHPAPPRLSSKPRAKTLLLAVTAPPQAGAVVRMRRRQLPGLGGGASARPARGAVGRAAILGLWGALGAPPFWGCRGPRRAMERLFGGARSRPVPRQCLRGAGGRSRGSGARLSSSGAVSPPAVCVEGARRLSSGRGQREARPCPGGLREGEAGPAGRCC